MNIVNNKNALRPKEREVFPVILELFQTPQKTGSYTKTMPPYTTFSLCRDFLPEIYSSLTCRPHRQEGCSADNDDTELSQEHL